MSTLTKLLIALTIFMTMAITITSTTTEEKSFDIKASEGARSMSGSPLGFGRFLADNKGVLKCDKNPRICHAKSSSGPDCCNKKCVDVDTDEQNCGLCGRKCKYMEICCNGYCVNPMVDKHHCGGCNYVCDKGDACVHGMCNYA